MRNTNQISLACIRPSGAKISAPKGATGLHCNALQRERKISQ